MNVSAKTLLDGTMPLLAQLQNVPNERWQMFVHSLTIIDDKSPQNGQPRWFGAKSYNGGFGCFDLRPRRLADLGLMRGIRVDNSSGRPITVGEFIRPMTEAKFLQSPLAQYNALLESLRRYDQKLPSLQDMTRSGALALLHRLGPLAMKKWAEHQEQSTLALFKRSNGLF